jgi:SAM-dependent methyltransferase
MRSAVARTELELMISTKRLGAAARYLSFASPPWRWAASRSRCPLCGPAVLVSLGPSAHMTRCTSCRATVTNLALIPVIERHLERLATGGGERRETAAYELSTYGSTLAFLRRACGTVTTSEYEPGRELGAVHAGVLNQDVQRLTFAPGSFDVVTSNQVFEHVPDDLLAFAECRRVLRPGGALIFSVPLYDTPASARLARLEGGRIEWLGTPEHHDSRIGGPRSAPVFWRHSRRDIAGRVAAAGFRDVELIQVLLAPCQRRPAEVLYAVR